MKVEVKLLLFGQEISVPVAQMTVEEANEQIEKAEAVLFASSKRGKKKESAQLRSDVMSDLAASCSPEEQRRRAIVELVKAALTTYGVEARRAFRAEQDGIHDRLKGIEESLRILRRQERDELNAPIARLEETARSLYREVTRIEAIFDLLWKFRERDDE